MVMVHMHPMGDMALAVLAPVVVRPGEPERFL
ncbi:hypothetical protein O185_16620 [Photorhabdus temperata J3]|uniref:Uncharacterized protein n=1 Tax=Photorhabdus temperata J3 TaxID=1389415 RepID=U7QY55_PHOTE|nr:hypothetical protein O185_16620 [Photorhabdus temperata J3]